MAKAPQRKKVAQSSELAGLADVNKGVENITETISGQQVVEHTTPPRPQPKKKKTIGRPAATHNRARTSVMVDPKLWRQIKAIAAIKGFDISKLVELSLKDAIKKYG
jgi:hypothetical protein